MAPFTVPFRRSGPPPYYRHHHYDCGDFPRTQRLMAFALFFSFLFFIVFIFIFHFNKSAGVVLLLLAHNLHSSSSMQHAIMMMMMFEEWKVRSSVGRGLLYFRSGEKYLNVNPHDIRRCAGTPCIVKNWQLRRDSRASSSFLVVFLVWFVGAITVLLRDWETSVGGSAIFLWPFLRVSLLLVHFSN